MALITNLVSYYKFDEGAGTVVGDATSGARNGTWNGTLGSQWVAGKIGRAGSFNGTDNSVSLSSAPLSGTGSFSIAAWVKTSSTGTRKDIFVNGANSVNNDEVALFINASNQIEVDLTNVAGPNSTATVTDGVFHLVGVSNNANSFQIYVDGVASGTPVTLTPNLATNFAFIGRESNTGIDWFNGVVDELGIWTRSLTAADWSQLYNAGAGLQYPFSSGPVLFIGGSKNQPMARTDMVVY